MVSNCLVSLPSCTLQAKLAKLRRELLEPSKGAGGGGGGEGEQQLRQTHTVEGWGQRGRQGRAERPNASPACDAARPAAPILLASCPTWRIKHQS